MTIYFDTEKEAYGSLETLQNWGKTLLVSISDKEYLELLDGKRVWQGDEIVINACYEEEKAKQKAKETIAQLKQELQAEDYKIIKMVEASISGSKSPYDNTEEILETRNLKRTKINELQIQYNL